MAGKAAASTDLRRHGRRVRFATVGPSLTRESFKDECDVNNILRRFEKTGVVEHVRQTGGRYGDFTGAVTYHEALNQVLRAEEMFMSLPAKIRARFSNDPGEFLVFVEDPANADELVQLGLVRPAPVDPSSTPSDSEPPEAGVEG